MPGERAEGSRRICRHLQRQTIRLLNKGDRGSQEQGSWRAAHSAVTRLRNDSVVFGWRTDGRANSRKAEAILACAVCLTEK